MKILYVLLMKKKCNYKWLYFISIRNVFSVIWFFIPNTVLSQNSEESPLTPSANAISLGLFGEVPVSLFSGVPQITIPIYEINTKNIKIPISLSYHASGVRPEVHSSWVGLGWSLNAGGAITRIVKGYADEDWVSMSAINSDRAGYYHTHSKNNIENWSSDSLLGSYRYGDHLFDYEPDEFHFSFPGGTGVFFLDESGNWRVQSDKPVKVIFNGNLIEPFSNKSSSNYWKSSKTFESFTIINELGVKFIFGEEDAIEYSDHLITPYYIDPNSGSPNPDIYSFTATSWLLKRVISADGKDVIEFEYERGPYQAALFKSYNSIFLQGPNCGGFSSIRSSLGGKLISPVYLKSIAHSRSELLINFNMSRSLELNYSNLNFNELFNDNNNGAIRSISALANYYNQIPYFDTSEGKAGSYENSYERLIWFKLNSINISSRWPGDSKNLKSIIFAYDNTASERLRLSKLSFRPNPIAATIAEYNFDYYNDFSLPNYLTNLGDHWGFYNDTPIESNYTQNTFIDLKEPTTEVSKAISGSLKSITYPTKGKSVFEYEQHTYSHAILPVTRTAYPKSGVAGGLRIKRIKNISNNGNEEIKEYYYVKNYKSNSNVNTLPSSGVLESEPKYYFSGSAFDQDNRSFTFSFLTSNPIIPMSSNSSGQYIGYSEVVEKRIDGAYTIYKFTNHENGYEDLAAINTWNERVVPHIPYNSRSFERGRLLEKLFYTASDSCIESVAFEFSRPFTLSSARCISQHYKNSCIDNAMGGTVTRTAYLKYYYPFTVKKQVNKSYSKSSGEWVTKTKNFTYNDQGLLNEEVLTNSSGKTINKAYTYGYYLYYEMLNRNMLDFKRTITTKVDNIAVETNTTEYDRFRSFYPSIVKQRATNNDPEVVKVIYDNYKEGNLTQQTLQGGLKESFLWGYNATLPVAKVVNAGNIPYDTIYISTKENGSVSLDQTIDFRSVEFTSYYSGDINFNIRLTGPPTKDFIVFYTLTGPENFTITSTLCFKFTSSFNCASSGQSMRFSDLPPGNYTLQLRANTNVWAAIDYDYTGKRVLRITGLVECYYQSFEELGTSFYPGNRVAKTGKYYHAYGYTVNFYRPNNREYVISYWYLNNGVWTYSGEIPYTSNSYFISEQGVDEIRVYPKDAQMTTYTYDPLIGMTSETDANGKTVYYYYDSFNRLDRIEDNDHNIIEKYRYNYGN